MDMISGLRYEAERLRKEKETEAEAERLREDEEAPQQHTDDLRAEITTVGPADPHG